MSTALDMMEVKRVVVGEAIEMDLASISSEDSRKAFIKEEATAPSLTHTYQHDGGQCFQCLITFPNSKALERHMRNTHREEYKQHLQQRPDTIFSCYVCDRTFVSTADLTEHQGTHSKEDRPFKCRHCQASFRAATQLRAHKKLEHRRGAVPLRGPYSCPECGQSFGRENSLRAHRRIHGDLQDPTYGAWR